jgi:hypothetical protein
MMLTLHADFRAIATEIVDEGKTIDEWAEIESDDMFQRGAYCGGFDATEMQFTFSFFDPGGREFWFQLSLADLNEVATGRIRDVAARPAKE